MDFYTVRAAILKPWTLTLDLTLLLLITFLWIYPREKNILKKLVTEVNQEKPTFSIILVLLVPAHALMCAWS